MKNDYKVLGINYEGHDTSAAIMIDGKLIAACEEERFNLEKHTRAFPKYAINECIKIAKIKMFTAHRHIVEYDLMLDFAVLSPYPCLKRSHHKHI